MTRDELFTNIVFCNSKWKNIELAKLDKVIDKLYEQQAEELKQAWIDGSDANYKALKEAGKLR